MVLPECNIVFAQVQLSVSMTSHLAYYYKVTRTPLLLLRALYEGVHADSKLNTYQDDAGRQAVDTTRVSADTQPSVDMRKELLRTIVVECRIVPTLVLKWKEDRITFGEAFVVFSNKLFIQPSRI